MRQSELFSKTSKTFPKDEESVNAKYLIRAGYIRKSSAGVYSYLPLGWRVLDKINNIVRQEMAVLDAQEVLFPALIAKNHWQKSGRWDVDIAYKIKTPHKDEYALGWTQEEIAAELGKEFILSPKDLPKSVYQIQTKFRMEPRPRSGLIRGREFLMKDLYSFHADKKDLENFYKKVEKAYLKIFQRLGLPVKIVEASGGAFTKDYTHEFQVLTDSGEDTVFYCDQCSFAQNKEIAKVAEGDKCPNCRGKIKTSRAIEVGNIFRLGQRFSPPTGGWWMGSYGLGPSRAMGTIVEISYDDRGLIWPASVAPYQVHLLELGTVSAVKVFNELLKIGIEVLYDDRPVSAGEKFADADLVGIPWRLVVSEKTGQKIEVKARNSDKSKLISAKDLIKLIKS